MGLGRIACVSAPIAGADAVARIGFVTVVPLGGRPRFRGTWEMNCQWSRP